MSNNQNLADKEWKGIKLTPIEEEEDGSNNYTEFKQKLLLDLDAAGYLKYVDGPDYNPPVIPKLRLSQQVQGLDSNGASVTITVLGNKTVIATAKQQTEAWLAADKKAHAVIVKAVPIKKLYVVRDCKSAYDAWMALKNEYEPANALTAVTIKQQIISYQCGTHKDPVHWRQVMVQLYQKLRDADPTMIPDSEFAKHLVTLMMQADAWRYCRDSLRDKVCQAEHMGKALSSAAVLEHLKHEEVEMRITPSIVSINALVTGRGINESRDTGDAVPSAYAVGSSNQNDQRNDRAHQQQDKRPTPYNGQPRSAPWLRTFCENVYCKRWKGRQVS
ncbi:hypothetical protein DFH07DRAFT_956784 [Mycena maculata]|uniref:Uncharacterized protein n=1 Tax=Mycena maculata TaxID=230809 RepID=A0AAD7JCZ2_9AGAR|nr:hypothetical protein DFH07DRAFT_956784 [Mycena maculata]